VFKCKYCFAIDPARKGIKILPDELLEKIIRNAFETKRKTIVFEWTGGEVLLAGKSFFEKILLYQAKYSNKRTSYENVLQTSGGIYNESLYDFLVGSGFNISLTIDGPKDLHNFHRPYKNDKASFDTVLKSFRYLQKIQGSCGAISTVSKKSLGREKEIIKFFKSIGLKSWHSNHYMYDPGKPNKDQKIAITPKDYHRFFINQLDAYLQLDDPEIDISFIRYFMKSLMGIQCPTMCNYGGHCLTNFINFDPEGNAAICPKFMGYEGHRLGNIRDKNISELLSPDNLRMSRYIDERIILLEKCNHEKCKYLPVCNGGCPYMCMLNSTDGKSIENKDILCEAKQKILRTIDNKLHSYGVKTYTQYIKKCA
jgi:uncharacterized protein